MYRFVEYNGGKFSRYISHWMELRDAIKAFRNLLTQTGLHEDDDILAAVGPQLSIVVLDEFDQPIRNAKIL